MCKRWNAMEYALAQSVAGAGPPRWKMLADAAPELRAFDDGKAMLAHLHAQKGSDAERDNILSALVRASRSGGASGNLARDLVWLALWPGLTALRRRLAGWGAEDVDELGAQIASTFADVLNRLEPTASMKVAATLLWNTRKYVSRILHDGVVARGVEVRLHVDTLVNNSGTADADWAEVLSDLLVHAGPDAELVLACVVEGLTMREAALRCQLPTEVVKKRMQRVVRRMRANASVNSAGSYVPFSREKELIGGEKRKRRSLGQLDEVGRPASAGANQEATHVLDNDKARVAKAARPRSVQRPFRTTCNYLRRVRRFCKSKCTAAGVHGADDMKTPTLPMAVLVAPANERILSSAEKVVAYCDVCRRWGERGTIHVCGENWSEHLLSVLAATGRSR